MIRDDKEYDKAMGQLVNDRVLSRLGVGDDTASTSRTNEPSVIEGRKLEEADADETEDNMEEFQGDAPPETFDDAEGEEDSNDIEEVDANKDPEGDHKDDSFDW